jgi:hypothetical protein
MAYQAAPFEITVFHSQIGTRHLGRRFRVTRGYQIAVKAAAVAGGSAARPKYSVNTRAPGADAEDRPLPSDP